MLIHDIELYRTRVVKNVYISSFKSSFTTVRTEYFLQTNKSFCFQALKGENHEANSVTMFTVIQ